MPTDQTTPAAPARRIWRSTGALLLGIIVGAALSLGTDELLHVLNVYPPWGQPMHEPGLNLLALSYRLVYSVIGSYIVSRFAPYAPMRHSMVSGVIGLIVSSVGVIVAMKVDLGPLWYPVALALSTVPCAWLGGILYLSKAK